jgi:pyruvate kinase
VKRGDLVAITAGLPLQQAGTTNMITVKPIE